MLRLTELKLPLDHAPDAVAAAVIAHLALAPGELTSCTVFQARLGCAQTQFNTTRLCSGHRGYRRSRSTRASARRPAAASSA